MSECKSCHAPIRWARTVAGKNMPLDVDELGEVAIFDDGNVEQIGWDGPLRRVQVVAPRPGLHRSHFASCPSAREHRK